MFVGFSVARYWVYSLWNSRFVRKIIIQSFQ